MGEEKVRRRNIRLFKIKGIQVGLDYSWFIIFLLVFWSLSAGYLPHNFPGYTLLSYIISGFIATFFFFSSILIHELMHSFTALHFGIKIPEITFFVFGGISRLSQDAKMPLSELQIAVAGPLSSFALAGFFWIAGIVVNANPLSLVTALLNYLTWVNLALGVFNLVPAFPLDGGRVLRAIWWWKTGSLLEATRVASDIGKGFAVILMLLGAVQIFTGSLIGGLWFIFIGMFLRGMAATGYHDLVMRRLLENVKVRELMVTPAISVPGNITLRALVEDYFLKYHYRGFPVTKAGKVAGMILLAAIREISREEQETTMVQEIMTPVSGETTVLPGESLAEALKKMTISGAGRLLVLEDESLVGMITRGDLLRYLEVKTAAGE